MAGEEKWAGRGGGWRVSRPLRLPLAPSPPNAINRSPRAHLLCNLGKREGSTPLQIYVVRVTQCRECAQRVAGEEVRVGAVWGEGEEEGRTMEDQSA